MVAGPHNDTDGNTTNFDMLNALNDTTGLGDSVDVKDDWHNIGTDYKGIVYNLRDFLGMQCVTKVPFNSSAHTPSAGYGNKKILGHGRRASTLNS